MSDLEAAYAEALKRLGQPRDGFRDWEPAGGEKGKAPHPGHGVRVKGNRGRRPAKRQPPRGGRTVTLPPVRMAEGQGAATGQKGRAV